MPLDTTTAESSGQLGLEKLQIGASLITNDEEAHGNEWNKEPVNSQLRSH